DVVLRRSEPASGDDHIGPGQGQAERVGDPLLVVADGLMVQDIDADLRQSLGYPLRIAVGDLAQEDLGSDADDLGLHPAALSSDLPQRPGPRSQAVASTAYLSPVNTVS